MTSATTKRTNSRVTGIKSGGGEDRIVSLKVVGKVSLRRLYLSKDLKEVRRVSQVGIWGGVGGRSIREEKITKRPQGSNAKHVQGSEFTEAHSRSECA